MRGSEVDLKTREKLYLCLPSLHTGGDVNGNIYLP